MATLTLSAEPSGLSKTVTISAAEITRIMAAYRAAYGQINEGTAEVPVWRDRTDPEVFDALAVGIFRSMREVVINYERSEAFRVANDALVPVVIV